MKRIVFLAALCAALGLALTSGTVDNKKCENSARATRSVAVSNFSGIDASHGVNVVYTPSSTVSATVEAPEAMLPYVKVVQRGEMLNISITGNNVKYCGKVRVKVSAPVVNTYIVSTGAEVKVKGVVDARNRDFSVKAANGSEVDIASVTCKELVVNADTGADVEIGKVAARAVFVMAESGADVELAGEAPVVTLAANTSGKVDAAKLTATSGIASAETGGAVGCCVTGKFTKRTSTGGKVSNVND